MKTEKPLLDLLVAEQMSIMLSEGTNLDRDRTRVLALIKVLPKYFEKMAEQHLDDKKTVKKKGK